MAAVSAARKTMRNLRLPPMPSVRDLIKLYKLHAFKHLSQNFLLNERITSKLVRAAGNIEGAHVCEVGPGPGSITRSIMREAPASLTVVEKDERFLPTLQLLMSASKESINFNVILGDILRTNMNSMFPQEAKHDWHDKPPNIRLLGNLPFSISTILVIRWLENISKKENAWSYGRVPMTLTFQKEVADRMVATETDKPRCRLSVMCQNWCRVKYNFTISGESFIPPPKVDVGVVTLTPLREPIIPVEFKIVEKFLRTTFNMRQKYCRRGISNLFPEDMREALTPLIFEMADLDPLMRPFQISNLEFKRLILAYSKLIKLYPHIADYDYRACRKVSDKRAKIEDDDEDEHNKFVLAV